MERLRSDLDRVKRDFHIFVAAVALLYVVIIALGAITYIANQHRIDDINSSRTSSCRQTYEGVREVFLPFFAPPEERTAEQKKNYKLFNDTINERKQNCGKQTAS